MNRMTEKNMTTVPSIKSNGKLTEGTDFNSAVPLMKVQDPQTLQELIGLESLLEDKRTEFLTNIQDSISGIQAKLQSVKAEIRNDFTMEIRDADYYRVNMFQLEGRISQLKETIREELCSLVKEEAEVNKELQGLDRRLEEWSKPLNARIFKPVINSAYRRSSQEEDDPTSEFQKFISSSGGHTGGWEEQDHLIFLRERRKYNGKRKFITAVHSILPDVSEDQIVAHETWYQRYENLKQGQKEAIKRWRAHKSAIRERLLEPPSEEKDTVERNRPKNPAYQRDIAERIKEWKRQQLIRKEEEEEFKREEQQRQHEERMRQKELQNSKKQLVDQYKAEKLSRLQAELLSQQMKELQALEERARKSVLLKAFREQDQRYIERKKFRKIQSALKDKEKTERIDNVKPSIELTVERDPQRVLKPTEVWSQHCLKDDPNVSKPLLHLKSMPHLAVPTWRKGLSNI